MKKKILHQVWIPFVLSKVSGLILAGNQVTDQGSTVILRRSLQGKKMQTRLHTFGTLLNFVFMFYCSFNPLYLLYIFALFLFFIHST